MPETQKDQPMASEQSGREQLVDLNHRVQQDIAGGKHPSPFVAGKGRTGSRVAMIAMYPESGETDAFTGKLGRLLAESMERCGVGLDMVYLTYLFKTRPDRKEVIPRVAPYWCQILREELAIVKPRAVILLGPAVAKYVLGVGDQHIERLRHTRFFRAGDPDTNWFVTFSPEEVFAKGGLDTAVGTWWNCDHSAVFSTIPTYFSEVKVLES